MAQRYKSMSLIDGLTDMQRRSQPGAEATGWQTPRWRLGLGEAVDWEELGRGVRQAAAEAAALDIDPLEQIREPSSCLTCARSMKRKDK